MASDIWNPNDIKNIADGWDDDDNARILAHFRIPALT